jgi:HlyD family type I secretion membrane fusion protein
MGQDAGQAGGIPVGQGLERRCDTIARRADRRLVLVVSLGLVATLVWAATTSLDRVARGSGRIVPQTRNQIVQHFEGGIVSEVLVAEGQHVEAGQPLIRIDNSFSRAELQQNQVELKARQLQALRLAAETRGEADFEIPQTIQASLPQIVAQERALFRSRGVGLAAQLAVASDQLRQKELELAEMRSRWTSTIREREIVMPRVESLRRLATMGAVSNNDLLEAERGLQQIEARIASLVIDVPRLEAAASELVARKDEIRARFRSDAEKERRENAVQIAKLDEAIAAMRDRSNRSEVVAPVSGIVNKLFVGTIGGVVKSGEPLVQLVPADAPVVVEARLSPKDRADVWPGLPAVVKISAYEYSHRGGLEARILEVSPDAFNDEKGEPFFRVRLEAKSGGFGPGRPIIPGMLAQVDILTGRQTILDYVLRPVSRVRDAAFRD